MSTDGVTSPSALSVARTPSPSSPRRYPQLQRRPSRHSSSQEPSPLLEPEGEEDDYDLEMCADEVVSYGRRNFIELYWDPEFDVNTFMRKAHATAKRIRYTPVPGCLVDMGLAKMRAERGWCWLPFSLKASLEWRDCEDAPDFPACSATPFDSSISWPPNPRNGCASLG